MISTGLLLSLVSYRKTWGVYNEAGKSIFDDKITDWLGNGVLGEVVSGIVNSYSSNLLGKAIIETADITEQANVPTFPVEQGYFMAYNKIKMPREITLQIIGSGLEVYRTQFIARLQKAREELELLTIVTPSAVYENMNVIGFNYQRNNETGTLIVAGVRFQEIRQSVTQYQTLPTAQEISKGVINNGVVNPQDVNPATSEAAIRAIP